MSNQETGIQKVIQIAEKMTQGLKEGNVSLAQAAAGFRVCAKRLERIRNKGGQGKCQLS